MDSFWFHATLNSAAVVVGVLILSTLIALPLGWFFERTDISGAKILRSLFTWPYILPPYLLAMAWITLANPDVGWVNLILKPLTGGPVLNIYKLAGIIFIESSTLFAIVFLAFSAGLSRLDPALEEAARLSGAGPFRVFFSITLPTLRNTVFLSLVTVALTALASFGVPAMIGGPAHVFVLTTGIYSLLKQGSPEGFHEALVVAVRMAAVALAVVVFSKSYFARKASGTGGRISRPSRVELGPWRIPLALLTWLLWFVLLGFPLTALVISSFQGDPSSVAPSTWTLRYWHYVLTEMPEFGRSVSNSLILSFSAALIVLALSLGLGILGWEARRSGKKRWRLLTRFFDELASAFNSLPGTVLALLLLVVAARFPVLDFRDTLAILVVAFSLKTLAMGFNTLIPAALLIHPTYVEAAKLSGARFPQRLRSIWFPLLKPVLLAAGILIFMPCLWELSMSVLLYGPGTENLGVILFQLQDYADRPSAAVVGTLLLAAAILFEAIVQRRSHES